MNHIEDLALEIDYLRGDLAKRDAEIERLKAEIHPDWNKLEACRESLREHMALVREREAEIERLREALREIDNLICWEINPTNYDHDDVCRMNAEWCEIGDVARAALAGKGDK